MTNDQVLIFYWELFIYHMKHLIISMKIYFEHITDDINTIKAKYQVPIVLIDDFNSRVGLKKRCSI